MWDAERWLAGFVTALCVVFLIRLMVGQRRRARFDATMRSLWYRCARQTHQLWQGLRKWPARRRVKREAAQEAQALIERARRKQVERRGNVITPQAFAERRQRGQQPPGSSTTDPRSGHGPH